MQFVTASLRPRNDRSGADTDILGPRNAVFGFDGAPEQRSGLLSPLVRVSVRVGLRVRNRVRARDRNRVRVRTLAIPDLGYSGPEPNV